MAIREILEKALVTSPQNESTTCDWVIRPILLKAGYEYWEILSQLADANGQFPDYTLLPNTEHTWYLEAKDWNISLQDKFAQQSLNYANQNGRRWVVLTNGKDWRLYDNRIEGTAADKLVTTADISSLDDIVAFAQALSKSNVKCGGLERYASNARLAAALGAQLVHPNSPVIIALHRVLRKQQGLQTVTREDLVAFFRVEKSSPEAPPKPAAIPPPVQTTQKPAHADSSPAATAAPAGTEYPLDTLREQATGQKPAEIRFPDGTKITATKWADLAIEFIKWIASKGTLPVPFPEDPRLRYFFNTKPTNKIGGRMEEPKQVDTPSGIVYMEGNSSAKQFLALMTDLCRAMNEDPAQVRIRLR